MLSLPAKTDSSPLLTREQEMQNALDAGIAGGKLDFHEYYLVRYRGLAWDEVTMLEDCFDGETEIEAAHQATWIEANSRLIQQEGILKPL